MDAGGIATAIGTAVAAVVGLGQLRGYLQRRREEQSASIRLEAYQDRLYVHNDGPADARNVRLFINGAPLSAVYAVMQGVDRIPFLAAGTSSNFVTLPEAMFPGYRSITAEARWEDGSGKPRTRPFTISPG